ncbi:hypothetical protein ACKWTF_014352 [Chironomus riparius]
MRILFNILFGFAVLILNQNLEVSANIRGPYNPDLIYRCVKNPTENPEMCVQEFQKYIASINQFTTQQDVPYLEQLKNNGYNGIYPARRG